MAIANIEQYCETKDFVDIKMRATHLEYMNGNSLWYTLKAAKNGGKSWVTPYNLPQLLHHDKHKDPVGRVIDYKIKNTKKDINPIDGEPENFIELTVRISDKKAMANVLRGLYNTGSVGSSANKVICSECGQVITEDGLCEHDKGSLNDKGKPVYWIIDNITYRENSFVNTPADSWARIVDINLGDGFTPYNDFLDNREVMIKGIITEDSMIKNAKLTADARKKLPESAFCGPERSFPAHDKAHVEAGLSLLDKQDFSDNTKNKIKASLYRKGKQYGIIPSDDELTKTPELKTFRIDDKFTEDEVTAMTEFFKDNVDADLPTVEVKDETPVEEITDSVTFEDVKKKTKADIITYAEGIIKEHNDAVSTYTKEITDLKSDVEKKNNNITEKDSILNAKEDQLSKLLDDNAVIENKYRKSLVSNILDLKELKADDTKEDLENKYMARGFDSLVDTINDLRSLNLDSPPEKVDDPTLTDGQEDNKDTKTDEKEISDELTPPDSLDPKFGVFFTKRN